MKKIVRKVASVMLVYIILMTFMFTLTNRVEKLDNKTNNQNLAVNIAK